VARRARVTTWYARQAGRLINPGTERALAVAGTVRTLVAAEELPGASDFEATLRPVGRAWVRRVKGRNLWLWYRFDDAEVMLIAVTTEPPVPLDDDLKLE
jgi:hypothetical protein